jgi:hypothetical protein
MLDLAVPCSEFQNTAIGCRFGADKLQASLACLVYIRNSGMSLLWLLASGSYMEVQCIADLEPLVEFGIVPKQVVRKSVKLTIELRSTIGKLKLAFHENIQPSECDAILSASERQFCAGPRVQDANLATEKGKELTRPE